MTRETLQTILRSAGLQEKAGTFRASPEQRLTLYVGNDGRGLVASQTEEVKLEEGFALLKTKESVQIFAEYAAIYAVSAQGHAEHAKKAGFV